MVPHAKFDISLKNTPPGLAPFCTESWQRFPPIFFSISLAPTNIVVRVHTKNYGKTRKPKGIYGKLCGGERYISIYLYFCCDVTEGPATGEISYTLLRNPRKSTEMKSEIKKSREKSVNFQIRNHLKSRET